MKIGFPCEPDWALGCLPCKPAPPLDPLEFDARIAGLKFEWGCELPGEFLSFYKQCNGISLFGGAIRFRPLEAVEPVGGFTTRQPEDYPDYLSSWDSGPWVCFGDLVDGGFAAIELRHTYERGWKVVLVRPGGGAVCPIVAWSFAGFLEQALSSGGRLEALKEVP